MGQQWLPIQTYEYLHLQRSFRSHFLFLKLLILKRYCQKMQSALNKVNIYFETDLLFYGLSILNVNITLEKAKKGNKFNIALPEFVFSVKLLRKKINTNPLTNGEE